MLSISRPVNPNAVTLPVSSCPFLFDQAPPSPALRVSVVVPVRNECDHLTQTLDALRNQLTHNGLPMPYNEYEVLLLTNNCTDNSYELARGYQVRFPDFPLYVTDIQLSPDKANIGHVRRKLMDEACRRLLLTGGAGIIASTDGDTEVDSRWISQTIAEIERGNDAVGGRILTRPDRLSNPKTVFSGNRKATAVCPENGRRYHLLDVAYRHLVARVEDRIDPAPNDPWPRHFQHFGASFAVTCPAYLRAGRLPEVPYLEDDAFYRALRRIDAPIRKSPLVKVFTSTRTQGRVAVGFSWQLNQWAAMTATQQLPLVEGPDVLIRRFTIRRSLRDCWQTMAYTDRCAELKALADELHLDADWLCRRTATSPYFGQLYEDIEQQLATGLHGQAQPLIPITTAIRALREWCMTP